MLLSDLSDFKILGLHSLKKMCVATKGTVSGMAVLRSAARRC